MQAAADPFGDLFGVAPFEANGSGGGGAATAPAPAAIPPGRVQNLVDVFVSVPFSGAAGGTGSPPQGALPLPLPLPLLRGAWGRNRRWVRMKQSREGEAHRICCMAGRDRSQGEERHARVRARVCAYHDM